MSGTATKPAVVTTDDLMAALRVKYGPPGYVLVEQVRDATGWGGDGRSADALAMGVWPSRGLDLLGFEVKASRADWRRELRNPKKAEAIAPYCDAWSLVAPEGVIPRDEVPPAWGLLELKARGLVQTAWPKTPMVAKPIDRKFLASLLRNAYRQGKAPGDRELREQYDAGHQAGLESGQRMADSARSDLGALRQRLAEFERTSGVRIDGWGNIGEVGAVVKIIRDGGLSSLRSTLRTVKMHAEHLAAALDQADAMVKAREDAQRAALLQTPTSGQVQRDGADEVQP